MKIVNSIIDKIIIRGSIKKLIELLFFCLNLVYYGSDANYSKFIQKGKRVLWEDLQFQEIFILEGVL